MSDNNSFEFGFDDSKVIKSTNLEQWKQARSGEVSKISVIAFKKYHDVVLAQKANEKGSPLTDEEKAGYIAKIDAKLAENLKKPVDALTEADKLDIKNPKFAFAFTHGKEGLGTIRCLSRYSFVPGQGHVCQKPEVCCQKLGDAEQTVATVIMSYPVGQDGQVDEDLLVQRKYTGIWVYKMASKKYKQRLEAAYTEARADQRYVIDLKVVMEGDPKYQKQTISPASNAVWARDGLDPSVRAWVLDQGLRNWKYVNNSLGFEMTKEKFLEKMSQGTSGNNSSQMAAPPDQPRLASSYEDMLK